jgi:hypothetical protein
MGMPNAYKCEVCQAPVYFDNTNAGRTQMQTHYTSQRHSQPVPDSPNAYKCHHDDNCPAAQKYAPDERLMIEHYRTEH